MLDLEVGTTKVESFFPSEPEELMFLSEREVILIIFET